MRCSWHYSLKVKIRVNPLGKSLVQMNSSTSRYEWLDLRGFATARLIYLAENSATRRGRLKKTLRSPNSKSLCDETVDVTTKTIYFPIFNSVHPFAWNQDLKLVKARFHEKNHFLCWITREHLNRFS